MIGGKWRWARRTYHGSSSQRISHPSSMAESAMRTPYPNISKVVIKLVLLMHTHTSCYIEIYYKDETETDKENLLGLLGK